MSRLSAYHKPHVTNINLSVFVMYLASDGLVIAFEAYVGDNSTWCVSLCLRALTSLGLP